jgi:steroid delta-isomerase-like uncharacterized protein
MSASETATRLLEAFNDGDWEAFREGVTDDVVYVEAGTGRTIEGAQAYLALCQGWRMAIPDVRGTVHRALEDDGVVAQEVTWVGTHDGPLPTPNGDIPATGRAISVDATLWVETRGDAVCEVHHHLDVMALMAQIEGADD